MKLRKQRKLGLFLREYDGAVVVSRVDPGSISAEILQQDDQFLELDGQRPRCKEEARTMIVKALRVSTSEFTSITEHQRYLQNPLMGL